MSKALIFVSDGFEDLEYHYPRHRLLEEDIEVVVAALRPGKFVGKMGYTAEATVSWDEVKSEDFEALILVGGKTPERIRVYDKPVKLTREFVEQDKIVGAICHGPQMLISAGVAKGRSMTCYQGIRDDLKIAGADYLDAEVVVDGNIVTSRTPDDLAAFSREIMRLLLDIS